MMGIREMKVSDVAPVLDLLAVNEGVSLLEWETPEVVASFLERCPRQAYIYEEDNEIVGCVFLGDGLRGCLQHLCVKDTHRGRGIGSDLVRMILHNYLSRTGVRRIHAVVGARV